MPNLELIWTQQTKRFPGYTLELLEGITLLFEGRMPTWAEQMSTETIKLQKWAEQMSTETIKLPKWAEQMSTETSKLPKWAEQMSTETIKLTSVEHKIPIFVST